MIKALTTIPMVSGARRVMREGGQPVTTVVPQQRTAVAGHGRALEVILASAPPGPATILACAVPPATSGPPLHIHAASDETFFVLSGVLLVHTGGRLAAISEGGLVRVSRGMPHTFATTPGSPARFLMLHTVSDAGALTDRHGLVAAGHWWRGLRGRLGLSRIGKPDTIGPADPGRVEPGGSTGQPEDEHGPRSRPRRSP
jgi:mannose-6-phosphate isomerase-like protein (cupin superfamily)